MSISGTERSQYLHEVDCLRFLAALSVVFYNLVFFVSVNTIAKGVDFGDLETLSSYGYLGVQLFFMISGFVIVMSAENRKPTAFIAARIGRLFPAFWAATTISATVIYLFGGDLIPLTLWQYVANLSMVPTYLGQEAIDGVYWTLAIELKFYALILICLLIAPNRLETALYLWAGVCAWALALPQTVPPIVGFIVFPEYAPFFMMGVLAYFARSSGWTLGRLGLGAALIAMALYAVRLELATYAEVANMHNDLLIVWMITCGWIAIFIAISLDRFRLPSAAKLGALGVLTYPLYLSHLAIGEVIMFHAGPAVGSVGALMMSLTATIMMTLFIRTAIERPFCRRLRRYTERRLDQLLDTLAALWNAGRA